MTPFEIFDKDMVFIGKNGSMGLKHQATYRCRLFMVLKVKWLLIIYKDGKMIRCPYNSIEALDRNWKETSILLDALKKNTVIITQKGI